MMLVNLCDSLKYFMFCYLFFLVPLWLVVYATNLICKKPLHPKKNNQSQRGVTDKVSIIFLALWPYWIFPFLNSK